LIDNELLSGLIVSVSVLAGAQIVANALDRTAKNTHENDVTLVQPITKEQLAREEVIHIIGPNGQKLQLKLPRTVTHGDRMRLEGEGFENKGDLYVLIKIIG